jgi:hypothetical protein
MTTVAKPADSACLGVGTVGERDRGHQWESGRMLERLV